MTFRKGKKDEAVSGELFLGEAKDLLSDSPNDDDKLHLFSQQNGGLIQTVTVTCVLHVSICT